MLLISVSPSIFLIFNLLLTGTKYASGETEKDVLRIGLLFSREGVFDFTGFIPAIELADETIANDSSLPFKFEMVMNDSMCQAPASIRGFIDQVTTRDANNYNVMLIGADCSVATEPVAEIASNWNLVQISPASSSPHLSSVKSFPQFLRTVSSDAEIVIGIIEVMKMFHWTRIALITQTENIFTFISTELKQELVAANLQLVREFTFNTEENVSQAVTALRNSPARIVFLNMYSEHAVSVMCEAYKHGMRHPEYAWMFFNWYMDEWWTDNRSCIQNGSAKAISQLEEIVLTSLVYDHYPRIEESDKDKKNIGTITWNDYMSYHNMRWPLLNKTSDKSQPQIEDSAYIFDALWTAALALNRTEHLLRKENLSLMNFTYETGQNISRVIYDQARNVSFFGLTGNVSFHENGDRPGKVRLLQYRRMNGSLYKHQFGRIVNGRLELDKKDVDIFNGETAQDEEHIHIVLPLFVMYTILSFVGIAYAIICLVFNLWFRNQKLVKLSSPYVNTMIAAGAVVFYVTVILFGVDENVASHSTVDGLCHARIWLVAIGFSLLFGTIFAKTWRIYYIFNYAKPNTKFEVKDVYLFAIVGILVLVDIVFLIPPTAVSSSRLKREDEEVEGDNPGDLPAVIGVCTSDGSVIWLPFLFTCKGFVLLAGLFLAFETRKVKIRSLNESRFVAMSIYGAVIVSIALTPIGFLLRNYPNTQYGIIGIMMLLSTSLILGLVFVTKMYKVYRDPEGAHSLDGRSHHTETGNVKMNVIDESEDSYKKRIEGLNEEVKYLNEKIGDLNEELQQYKSGGAQNNAVVSLKKVLDISETITEEDTTTL